MTQGPEGTAGSGQKRGGSKQGYKEGMKDKSAPLSLCAIGVKRKRIELKAESKIGKRGVPGRAGGSNVCIMAPQA